MTNNVYYLGSGRRVVREDTIPARSLIFSRAAACLCGEKETSQEPPRREGLPTKKNPGPRHDEGYSSVPRKMIFATLK
jgi:hypothetical protein